MSVTQWLDTPFGDEDAFKDFLMANDMAHNAIAASLIGQGRVIVSVPLADIGDDANDWLQAHQSIHQQEFDAMGLSWQTDLSNVDLTDEKAYYDWMQIHSMVHALVESSLNL